MNIEFAVITGLVSMVLGILGFYSGKMAAAKRDSKEDAADLTSIRKDVEFLFRDIAKDIGYIQKDINSIREALDSNQEDTSMSIKRLHERIDEHERVYHC